MSDTAIRNFFCYFNIFVSTSSEFHLQYDLRIIYDHLNFRRLGKTTVNPTIYLRWTYEGFVKRYPGLLFFYVNANLIHIAEMRINFTDYI